MVKYIYNQISRSFNQIRYSSSLTGREKEVTFRTCREFYASSVKRYLYRNGSSAGITINLRYLDTNPQGVDVPTILAIHGAPGSYRDFAQLIESLHSKGFRVIAPNFPDFKLTDRSLTFYHSTEEKCEMLHDFLEAIDVPTVDLALVHSAGIFPTMKLWHDKTNEIKSLVVINPTGHRTIKAMKPEWLINNLARLNLVPPGRALYRKFGHLVARAAKVKVDASKDASDDAVLACITLRMAGITRLVRYFEVLSERKTPTSFFYSDRDRLIDHDIFLEMLQILGAKENNINIAHEGEILRAAECNSDWLRVFNMKGGGHFAFKHNTKLLEDEIIRLVTASGREITNQQVYQHSTDNQWDLDDDFYENSGTRKAYALNMTASSVKY